MNELFEEKNKTFKQEEIKQNREDIINTHIKISKDNFVSSSIIESIIFFQLFITIILSLTYIILKKRDKKKV
ncbi:hypothetical protein LNTAR_06254 [Lentisphaera araneosa HTCC2155]|uniref:Uncharacterized protein n=1 Tax=Lentisphaera araneosa HTCC2155 TaxID=313628 RepID=A6DN77_9BACT|nr:hypothetical protein LNTAR_06254 [Lentisphaera araneosa HTCC2155]